MALNSRICEMLGIRYPILLAGMGGASVPPLAAAVSNAGGLGALPHVLPISCANGSARPGN